MSDGPPGTKPPIAASTPSDHDALPAGTRFGEFEIIRALGVGGFGIVYLAQDHSLERQVALKEYMPAALAARGAGAMITIRANSFVETYAVGLRSFINEARLLARFDHPSLVKVYRFWEDNGTAYMVMPYLQGRTVRDARRTLGRTPDEAWIRAVLDPMLDALELLHREGVFHRDVAPDNILLPPEGAPILLDFGAARRVISNRNDTLTAILKPSYAPIEQYAEMASMRQGPWTDLYALGAVLHFLVFGVPPAPATARAVQADETPIGGRVVEGISPRFMRVMNWMLGVRPLERPQDAAAVRAALEGRIEPPDPVRHETTRPMVAAVPATTFESTTVDSGYAPTWVAQRAAARAAGSQVSMAAGSGAPLRSTPPGSLPPAYVPPRRPAPQDAASVTPGPAPAPDASSSTVPAPNADLAADPSPRRIAGVPVRAWPRRRTLAGGFGAAVLGAALLWQFTSLLGRPPAAAPLAAAGSRVDGAGAAAAAATDPPQVSATAAPAAAGDSAAPARAKPEPEPARAAADVPVAPDRAPTDEVAVAPAPAGAVPLPMPLSVPASVAAGEAAGAREPEVRKSRAPHRAAAVARPADALRTPATAREACGDKTFISLAMCLDRQCERPRYRNEPSCERMLEAKRRRSGEY